MVSELGSCVLVRRSGDDTSPGPRPLFPSSRDRTGAAGDSKDGIRAVSGSEVAVTPRWQTVCCLVPVHSCPPSPEPAAITQWLRLWHRRRPAAVETRSLASRTPVPQAVASRSFNRTTLGSEKRRSSHPRRFAREIGDIAGSALNRRRWQNRQLAGGALCCDKTGKNIG